MKHAAVEQVLTRARSAKEESDFTYFFSLLLAAEALVKLSVVGILAAITDDKDRNRYRLEHALVRADGIGDWGKVLEDALTGPASQYLLVDARREQTELTRLCGEGDWQYSAVASLRGALDCLDVQSEGLPARTDMKRWFRLFAALRNATRGHGATLPSDAATAAVHLDESIRIFASNFALFHRPWAYLHRNMSGKYRVSSISDDHGEFDYLKREAVHSLADGVYVFFGAPRLVQLIKTDPELRDFYFANGGFNARRYELLSYGTDDKVDGDAAPYLAPAGTLPASETEGHGELLAMGRCLSNAPKPAADYVARHQLEEELYQLLMDDRHPIVTMVGAGGIGKTSLALNVLQRVFQQSRYEVVVWLSARDVDLLSIGPKSVRPFLLGPDDISMFFSELVLPPEQTKKKAFSARAYFEAQLKKSDFGSCLFVFDNFETTQNPVEMFVWIEYFIRPPNKALMTTRLREFKGDYPLDVRGMNDGEARQLIDQTARLLSIADIVTGDYVDQLILQSEGHPYVMKMLLGEVASARRLVSVPHVIAGRDEILTALFERTYAALSPCAQRALLTLAAWNSAVPRLALEAVMLRAVSEREEVVRGIESLLHYSMAESYKAPSDGQEFLALPLVTSLFGKKKLNVSASRAAIQADVEILQMLGPSRGKDINLGLARRLETFVGNIARRVEAGHPLDTYVPILEMICRAYAPGWLLLARWHMERGTDEDYERGKSALQRYLEIHPDGPESAEAWRSLAFVCHRIGDTLGEVHAFVERTQLSVVAFPDLSNTANLLNRLLRDHQLEMEKDEKQHLANRLLAVMDKRRGEADADAFSRMAWLALHSGQEARAIAYARAGLAIDPYNPHCANVAQRLHIG